MQSALYLDDSYLRSCHSKVVSVKDGKYAVLDRTVFFPRGGGVPWDTGKMVRKSDGAEFQVVAVVKSEGSISHELAPPAPSSTGSPISPLQSGEEVECHLDWERRHRLMRMHTAGHVLAAIMYSKLGLLITGNQIDLEKTRFDFSMENFDKAAFQSLVDQANAALARNLEVTVSYLPREEALKLEGAVKLAAALPPDIKELRMVKIGDVDHQADGGPHVKNTSEVGKIVFLGAENKGKSNRRIIFTLQP